ncbi:mechanosensitive ion channel family protein [Larkinella punicea]|uniref:Mechanosensitive ion channel family protein n=1 Tax=Larkinella punicea TaxID=2315727 RepID=A0A368JDG5_9BACT|nr:mechanosensitive ion channel family protein [Larkinella punicea]RCR65718.1 mechanosensitive ion channel family protein [Larkinella punicea]
MLNVGEVARLIFERLEGWVKTAVLYVPNLAVALLVIVIFNFISRYFRRLVVRTFDRFSDNLSLINLTGTVAQLVVMMLGLFIALDILGLEKTVASLLAGAGVLALAIGFAFQDLTANFISGTIIALQRPIEVGDVVETNGFLGKVVRIKLRSIVLDNSAGQTIEIPSKDIFQKPITNFSSTGERRIELTAGVSHLDDLSKAQRVAISAVKALPFIRKDKPVEMHYKGVSLEMIQFLVWFWIDPTKVDATKALSEAIIAVKKAFGENDVLMLFPPHTYDLKKRANESVEPSNQ